MVLCGNELDIGRDLAPGDALLACHTAVNMQTRTSLAHGGLVEASKVSSSGTSASSAGQWRGYFGVGTFVWLVSAYLVIGHF